MSAPGLFDNLDEETAADVGLDFEKAPIGRSPSGQCADLAPATFSGHWRDWHRGHGCELDPDRPETIRDVFGTDTILDTKPDGSGLDDGPDGSIVQPRRTPFEGYNPPGRTRRGKEKRTAAPASQADAGATNDAPGKGTTDPEARRLLAALRLSLIRVRAHVQLPGWLLAEVDRGVKETAAFVPPEEWDSNDPINARSAGR